MRTTIGSWLVLAINLCSGAVTAVAAQTSAVLTGAVIDPTGAPVSDAKVVVEHRLTAETRATSTGADGVFEVLNLPAQPFDVRIDAPGFEPVLERVDLRSVSRATMRVVLRLRTLEDTVDVRATSTARADVTLTGTRNAIAVGTIDRMPRAGGSRGLEAILVSFPGFAQNANGAIHPRGAHNQMTYLVDGLPISDQLTGAFANALDTALVQHVELITGNVPAEFGNKVSGVAVVTTRSGLSFGRPWAGEVSLDGGSFSARRVDLQVGGSRGRSAYFVTASALGTRRFLDQVSKDNLHNGGEAQRVFSRWDRVGQSGALTRVNAMAGRSVFELANLRSQAAAGQDQRQRLRDGAVWLSHGQSAGAQTTLEVVSGFRRVSSALRPSQGDRPVTSRQERRGDTAFLGGRLSRTVRGHAFRVGIDGQLFPVRERFSVAIADPGFNSPTSSSFNPALLPHDLTRGGAPFTFDSDGTGRLLSGFAQDNWRLGPVTAALGLRYDHYAFLARGSQWQPRVGLSWSLLGGSTVLRASYNRNYHLPPNENLLLSSSAAAAALAPPAVRAAAGEPRPLAPERQHAFESGLQVALGNRATLDVAAYYKTSVDQQDNNNFLETGIIFPVTLAALTAKGAELRATLPEQRGFSATLSLTMTRAIATPPFTGGLFLGQDAVDALAGGPFIIDHDQRLSVHLSGQQRFGRRWWMAGAIRYDSGLVANASDPVTVANDPDYADLLPYVDLNAEVPRVRPRTIADVVLGFDGRGAGTRGWGARLQVTNITNATALYNFQSVFVGTRLVQPRALSVRTSYAW